MLMTMTTRQHVDGDGDDVDHADDDDKTTCRW